MALADVMQIWGLYILDIYNSDEQLFLPQM